MRNGHVSSRSRTASSRCGFWWSQAYAMHGPNGSYIPFAFAMLETELYSVNQDDKMNPTRADYMQEGCRYLL